MNAKQVLEINYTEQQGLSLKWKYTDLNPYQTFYRHVIILLGSNSDQVNLFLPTYLKKLRSGDFFKIIYYNNQGKLKIKSWKEKSSENQTMHFNDIIESSLNLADKQTIMSKVEQMFGQFSEPIVVTVYLQNLDQASWFQTRVLKQRPNQKYDFIVGLFGPFKTADLSFSNQVNKIPFHQKNRQTVCFYLNQIYQAAILWARVSIQCLNAQISSSIESNWRNSSFSTIQRFYRGPSIQYDKDILHFYSFKNKGGKYNLHLKLTYVSLEGRKFVSEKQFSVISQGGFNKLTFSMDQWKKPYLAAENVWLRYNPYRSLTILKFGRENDQQP